MIQKIRIFAALAAATLVLSSCLEKYPEDAIPEDKAIRTLMDANQARCSASIPISSLRRFTAAI